MEVGISTFEVCKLYLQDQMDLNVIEWPFVKFEPKSANQEKMKINIPTNLPNIFRGRQI